MIEPTAEFKENCLLFLRAWTRSLAEKIQWSYSGYNFKIVREGLPDYRQVVIGGTSERDYNKIRDELNADQYSACFKIMLDAKMADCAAQSLFLAAMLKNSRLIDKNYVIFSTNSERCSVAHTFLTLIPRDSKFFENNKEFSEMTVEKKGRVFVDNKNDIIVVDPWRNMLFVHDLDASNHPLNFTNLVSFENTDFLFQNFDRVYKKLQGEFSDFYRPILIADLQRLSKNSPKLMEAMEKKNYNSALRLASADQNYIKVVRILVEHQELLGVDIHEKGKAGNALEVAKLKENKQAIELLEPFFKMSCLRTNNVSQGKSRNVLLPAPVTGVTAQSSDVVELESAPEAYHAKIHQ